MNEEVKSKKQNGILNISNKTKFTILAIVLIAIFCISLTPVTLQNDTYYTIKIGEHIDKYGVDMKDPFSWHTNLDYTYPHWGYDLLIYYIYSIFGMTGIYISTCVLAAILGVSIYLVNTKLAKNQLVSFIITIGAMYLMRGYIAARAQLVTFILFNFTIYCIEIFLEKKKKRYILGLIVIPILIANLHVAVFPFYFILYLPYIAEYAIFIISEIVLYRKLKLKSLNLRLKKLEKKQDLNIDKIEKIKHNISEIENKNDKIKIRRSTQLKNPYKIKLEKNENVKWLILIVIICALTGLLTPLGDTPYTYLVKTMQGNTTQNINEHLPMTLTQETDMMCTIIVFLSILNFTKAKIKLCDLFMLGGLIFLALSSRRQISMFAIICSVILNRLIMEVILIYENKGFENLVDKLVSKFIPVTLTVIIVLSLSFYFAKDKFNDKFISESTYPVKACDYILENIDLGKAKFYNEYNYGSYMLFRGIPVFIDSRADLYAPEFSKKEDDIFMDFIETSGIAKFYEDIFDKYGITHIITYENSKMNMIISKTNYPGYKELYKDKYFVIYERSI